MGGSHVLFTVSLVPEYILDSVAVAEIDHCKPNPCENGQCANSHGTYTCICDEGYTGTNCEDEEEGSSGGSGGSGG